MKIIVIAACLMLLFLAVPAQAQTVTAAQKAEIEKTIKEQITKYYAAWDSLSAEAARNFWSRDKIIGMLRATGLDADLDAITNGWKTTMESRKSNKVEVADIIVHVFTPEIALAVSKGIWRVELKNGNVTNVDFGDSMIWVKESGGWKLAHYAQRTAARQ